jgi:hypothetical protein
MQIRPIRPGLTLARHHSAPAQAGALLIARSADSLLLATVCDDDECDKDGAGH